MFRVVAYVLSGVVAGVGCQNTENRAAQPPPVKIESLYVDAARAPRDSEPLIAGEPVRIETTIINGTGPFTLWVRSTRRDIQLGSAPPDEPPAIDARTTARSTTGNSVTIALSAESSPRSPSGLHQVVLTVADTANRRATRAVNVTFIGADAPRRPPAMPNQRVKIMDVAHRERIEFVRGEQILVQADELAVNQPAQLVIFEPRGPIVASLTLTPRTASVEHHFDIPRLAHPGNYRVRLNDKSRTLEGEFRVRGARYKPVTTPVIDNVSLWGGTDRRSPRIQALQRGEHLLIEARVGGVQDTARATVRLKTRTRVVHESVLAKGSPAIAGPETRFFLAGPWRVPTTILPGNYTLKVEVEETDNVASRLRELRIE